MLSKKYTHFFGALLALTMGFPQWGLAENVFATGPTSNSVSGTASVTDIYLYTLTYTKSGQVQTSTCMDWAAATSVFLTAPACPGTGPDEDDDAPLFTARNYSTLTTAGATNTTTSASFVTTTSSSSAAVTYTDITGVIYGTTSGSASATSTSTSSASVLAGRLPLRSAVVVLFSSVYAFVA